MIMSASPELARSPLQFSPMPPAASKTATEDQAMRILSCLQAIGTDVNGQGECRTPTSEGSKLPLAPPSCPPPAPCRKVATRRAAICKRKLSSEFELIVVGAKEMEQLFRPRSDWAGHAKKIKKNKVGQLDE